MSENTNINYVTNNFNFKILAKVQDIITYEDFIKNKGKLKANAGKIQNDLHDRQKGYLGLVLMVADNF